MKLRRFALASGVGLGAVAILLLLVLLSRPGTAVTAKPVLSLPIAVKESDASPLSDATPLHFVAKTGTDGGDCSTPAGACCTIQYAVDQAGTGDEIRVAAGVVPSTLRRSMKWARFKAALGAAEVSALEEISRGLLRLATTAIITLEETMTDPDVTPATSARAADVVLARLLQLREHSNIEQRLSELEEPLYEEYKQAT